MVHHVCTGTCSLTGANNFKKKRELTYVVSQIVLLILRLGEYQSLVHEYLPTLIICISFRLWYVTVHLLHCSSPSHLTYLSFHKVTAALLSVEVFHSLIVVTSDLASQVRIQDLGRVRCFNPFCRTSELYSYFRFS